MIKQALFAVAGSVSASVWVGVESVLVIQSEVIGNELPVSGALIVQLGFLLTAAGLLLLAGKTVGRWQAAQETLITKVDKIDRSNLELRSQCSRLEGVVHTLATREGGPGLRDEDDPG